MTADRCSCRFTPGQTVIVRNEVREDGSRLPICATCQKDMSWRFVRKIPTITNRIQGVFQDPDVRHDHPVGELDASLFGKAAMSCGSCGRLTFWEGPTSSLVRMCDEILHGFLLICPRCNSGNSVPAEWEVMFR